MAHGFFPLPAPATLALVRGAPVVGVDGTRETVTPTAAAILTTLAHTYGSLPRMTPHAVGYGAGRRDDPTPNVLRVVVGAGVVEDVAVETVVELQANIDDMSPQLYGYVMDQLFAAGALDVTFAPIHMKKNRPGVELRVLAPPARAAALRTIILDETTTLGVRENRVHRYALARENISVQTEFGMLQVQVAFRPNGTRTVTPEYDASLRAASEYQVPLQTVLDAVKRQAQQALLWAAIK